MLNGSIFRENNHVVLVLDSDEAERKTFCRMLTAIGIPETSIICAETVQEALEIIETNSIDVCIIEASTKITEQYSICTLINASINTTVFLKVYIEDFGPIKAAAVRVHGLIRKPVNSEYLTTILTQAFRLHTIEQQLEKGSLKLLDMIEQCSP